ncbi:MAG: ribonuclease D [Coriobacteriia bacterium]|nr:ribonuclease D [Coriobacteriia bacterium]
MYVTDVGGLRELVERVRPAGIVGFDTEFLRERTYYARLCLVQVATDDVTAIVDPLALDDLAPLLEVLADPDVLKVVHAGSQDVEIFYHQAGVVPAPLFDTQLAATLAGFPSQVGYSNIVKELLSAELHKTETFTDWSRRPLSAEQVAYALDDVRYLPDVYRRLRERLEREGRLGWLEPQLKHLADPASYEVRPEEQYRRIKRLGALKPRQLGVLLKLAAWREREAMRRDVPRRWVLGDDALYEIARRAPVDERQLASIRGVGDKAAREARRGLLDAVRQGLAMPEDELPRVKRRGRPLRDVEGAVDLMAALVRLRARERSVALPQLATRKELELLAQGEGEASGLLAGWKREMIGEELVDLLEGRLRLAVRDGALVVERLERGADAG